ncbi:Sugar/inositol transporter [Niveomyces insectorum RCEF 264]|uniref:Sugar/inositol transporter n=1 Tax=Niveomyces insectorum RCEF 264 TaxID=1081102 RepID=A0A167U6M1_9HYPO|nr:Sugar/inositol transporter [Niveomyces insectorum RCEF 264]
MTTINQTVAPGALEETAAAHGAVDEKPAVDQAEWLADAQEANTQEHNLHFFNGLRLYRKSVMWSVAISTCIFMEGYDTMLMSNLFGLPAFQVRYGEAIGKGKYEVSAPWQSGLSNGSTCGQLIGLLVAGSVCEKIGYRKTMIAGLVANIALIFMTFFAPNVTVLLVGQILFGIAMGLYQTTPVVYALEISPVSLQAYLTTYVNTCWAIGHLIGAGILRGVLTRTDQWGYRIPFAIQWFWPLILVPVIFLAPESPWWLVRKGRLEDAKAVLVRLTSSNVARVDYDIDKNIALMVVTTNYERTLKAETSYLACFRGVDLYRTLISIGIYCIQTLSGNPLRGFSTYFLEKAGLPNTQSFNLTIVNYALALWPLLSMFGRRTIYVWSLAMMLVLMVIIGALGVPQAHSSNTSYSWAIGAILIVSSFLYNATMGPLTNTLCSEVSSSVLASKSVALARWFYAVSTIIANVLTPYQLNTTAWNWGAKTGFFWAGGCLISLVFAYFCVPETKNRTAAELDVLFSRHVSPRHFAKTPVDLAAAIVEVEGDKKM